MRTDERFEDLGIGPSSRPYGSQEAARGATRQRSHSVTSENGKEDGRKGKKRYHTLNRRVTQSCNVCRRKRIKCDGKDPVCGPCSSKGLECGWAAPKRRGPLPGRDVQTRIYKFESHLWDLFQVVPGLQSVSEILLGIQPLDLHEVQPSTLNVNLPSTLEDLQSLQNQEDRHLLFRELSVGKAFMEEGVAEGNSVNPGISSNHNNDSEPAGPHPAHVGVKMDDFTQDEDYQAILKLLNGPSESVSTGIYGGDHATLAHSSGMGPSTLSTSLPVTVSPNSPIQFRPFSVIREEGCPEERPPRAYGPSSGFGRITRSSAALPSREPPQLHSSPAVPHPAHSTRLVDLYLTVIHPCIPMCSRHQLLKWSSHPNPSIYPDFQPALFFIVLACSAPYLPPKSYNISSGHPDVSTLIAAARHHLAPCIKIPKLETVQALALLALALWSEGDMSDAWSAMAQCVACAIDLGLHLYDSRGGLDNDKAIAQRSTWYSILYLDVLLASLLGRCPLTPASVTSSKPPNSGSDEWELWKSESVDTLRQMYGAPLLPQNELLPTSYGLMTPARTLSTFDQTITLARIAHALLSEINSPERTEQTSGRLSLVMQELDAFRSLLGDMQPNDGSLSSVPQHRVDLYLLWYHLKLLLAREITHPLPPVEPLIQEVRILLACRVRLFSFYRSSVTSSLLPYTLTAIQGPTNDCVLKVESLALQEIAAIFPSYVEWMPIKSNLAISTPMHIISDSSSFLSSLPSNSPTSFVQQQNVFRTPASISTDLEQESIQLSAPPALAQAPAPDTLGHSQGYSLPFQAMESLSRLLHHDGSMQQMDTSHLFDSATWEQTDVLTSLGFLDKSIPQPTASQETPPSLTGMLERWSNGDGGY